jgi:hypothetical protein
MVYLELGGEVVVNARRVSLWANFALVFGSAGCGFRDRANAA